MPRVSVLPGDKTVTRNDSLISNDRTGTVNISVGDLAAFAREELADSIDINRVIATMEGQLGPSGISITTSKYEQEIRGDGLNFEGSFTLTSTDAVYVGNTINDAIFTNDNVIVGSLLILSNTNRDIPAVVGVIKNINVPSRRLEFNGLTTSSQLDTYGSSGDLLNTLTIVRVTSTTIDGDITIKGNITVEGDILGGDVQSSTESIVNQVKTDTEPPLLRFGSITQSAYQVLQETNSIDPDVFYFRRRG